MKIDFVSVSCTNFQALSRFTEITDTRNECLRFMESVTAMMGKKPTLTAVRDNAVLLTLIHLGVMTEGFNYDRTSVRVVGLAKDKRYWYGSIAEWRDDITTNLVRKDVEHEVRVFYSGVYQFIVNNIYKHVFYRYHVSSRGSDNLYSMEER